MSFRIPISHGHLVATDFGARSLDQVVVVQTALNPLELLPLCSVIAGRGGGVVHLSRRGYGGSSPARASPSVEGDARDIAEALNTLDFGPACVVGASYSAGVALTLAVTHPHLVRSVVAVETPPTGTAGAAAFSAANRRLLAARRAAGVPAAMDHFLTALSGDRWRADAEALVPGSVAAMSRDAATFFDHDVPALLGWRLPAAELATVGCPVLVVEGGASHPWFREMATHLAALLPLPRRASVAGAGHDVALTHADEVARLVLATARAGGVGATVGPGRAGRRNSTERPGSTRPGRPAR